MADQIVHGLALGVRDTPGHGMQVYLRTPYDMAMTLEPAEAAAVGAELIAQAEEAIHASRAARRGPGRDVDQCGNPAPSWLHPFECSMPTGHEGAHWHAGRRW